MNVSVTVSVKSNKALAEMQRALSPAARTRLNDIGGKEATVLIRNHLLGLAPRKHFTADGLGADRTGHLEEGINGIVHEADQTGSTITVPIPGIGRAYHDVTITPTAASALTLPLDAVAYGHRVSELMATGYKFFKIKSGKGSDILMGAAAGDDPRPMYLLRKSVTQKQDPSLLPSLDEIRDTAAKAMLDHIRAVVAAAKRRKVS